jgi:hypothetical protein
MRQLSTGQVDATAQMWWVIFIWAIGVAGVNAYRIYDVIYMVSWEILRGTRLQFHFPRAIKDKGIR